MSYNFSATSSVSLRSTCLRVQEDHINMCSELLSMQTSSGATQTQSICQTVNKINPKMEIREWKIFLEQTIKDLKIIQNLRACASEISKEVKNIDFSEVVHLFEEYKKELDEKKEDSMPPRYIDWIEENVFQNLNKLQLQHVDRDFKIVNEFKSNCDGGLYKKKNELEEKYRLTEIPFSLNLVSLRSFKNIFFVSQIFSRCEASKNSFLVPITESKEILAQQILNICSNLIDSQDYDELLKVVKYMGYNILGYVNLLKLIENLNERKLLDLSFLVTQKIKESSFRDMAYYCIYKQSRLEGKSILAKEIFTKIEHPVFKKALDHFLYFDCLSKGDFFDYIKYGGLNFHFQCEERVYISYLSNLVSHERSIEKIVGQSELILELYDKIEDLNRIDNYIFSFILKVAQFFHSDIKNQEFINKLHERLPNFPNNNIIYRCISLIKACLNNEELSSNSYLEEFLASFETCSHDKQDISRKYLAICKFYLANQKFNSLNKLFGHVLTDELKLLFLKHDPSFLENPLVALDLALNIQHKPSLEDFINHNLTKNVFDSQHMQQELFAYINQLIESNNITHISVYIRLLKDKSARIDVCKILQERGCDQVFEECMRAISK